MKYDAEARKAEKKARRLKLVHLWLECSSMPEFWLKQAIEVPEATWLEKLCFRLHWFRKLHGFVWGMMWLAVIAASIALVFCSAGAEGTKACLTTAAGFSLMSLPVLYCLLLADFMQLIEWHEEGCPRDY